MYGVKARTLDLPPKGMVQTLYLIARSTIFTTQSWLAENKRDKKVLQLMLHICMGTGFEPWTYHQRYGANIILICYMYVHYLYNTVMASWKQMRQKGIATHAS